jgi:hypothetical protein
LLGKAGFEVAVNVDISRLKVNKICGISEAFDCVGIKIYVLRCNLKNLRVFRDKTVMKSERNEQSYTTINLIYDMI